MNFKMSHPAVIRTKFASAEDAAKVYGVPVRRVKELRRLLDKFKAKRPQQRSSRTRSKSATKVGSASLRKNGIRRSARRAA